MRFASAGNREDERMKTRFPRGRSVPGGWRDRPPAAPHRAGFFNIVAAFVGPEGVANDSHHVGQRSVGASSGEGVRSPSESASPDQVRSEVGEDRFPGEVEVEKSMPAFSLPVVPLDRNIRAAFSMGRHEISVSLKAMTGRRDLFPTSDSIGVFIHGKAELTVTGIAVELITEEKQRDLIKVLLRHRRFPRANQLYDFISHRIERYTMG